MSDAATEARLLPAFWQVVAEHGWHGVTMARVSVASGLPLAELRRFAGSPATLLLRHARALDVAVLGSTVPDPRGTPRDRLFDALMRRLDALQPHRAGVLRLLDDAKRDPLLGFGLLAALPRSMAWMLEAAGIGTAGLRGALRVKGLGLVWLATLRAWADDPTEDLGPTMAALDRALDRAEGVARSLRLDSPGEEAADPEAAFMPSAPADPV